LAAVPAKNKTKVITVSVEDMYDRHKPKFPKCNKFIKFFYVTIINSCINRLPEGNGSVAFKQMVIIIFYNFSSEQCCLLRAIKTQRGEEVQLHSFSSSALWM